MDVKIWIKLKMSGIMKEAKPKGSRLKKQRENNNLNKKYKIKIIMLWGKKGLKHLPDEDL